MKGLSAEERDRILEIAGNPEHAVVEELKSVPGGYRILQRSYFYERSRKRSGGKKKAIGVVINDTFLSPEEYHSRYTHRGTHKVQEEHTVPAGSDTSEYSDITGIHQKMLGAVPLLYETAKHCNLVTDLHDCYGTATGDMILSSAFYFIQECDTDARRFHVFSSVFALPCIRSVSEQETEDLYSLLGRNRKALSRLFTLRCTRLNTSSYVCYDSIRISQETDDIRHEAVSTDADDLSVRDLHLSLLTEYTTGMPVLYSVSSENTREYLRIPDVPEEFHEFPIQNRTVLYISDRDSETFETFLRCLQEKKPCIMDASVLERDVLSAVLKNCSDRPDSSSLLPGTHIHGYSEEIYIEHRGRRHAVWVHVFTDDDIAAEKYAAFELTLDDFEKQWNSADTERRRLLTSHPLIRFYRDSGLESPLERLPDEIDACTEYSGFSACVSSIRIPSADAYRLYTAGEASDGWAGALRMRIPSRDAHLKDAVEGRYVIAYISRILLSELQHQLSLHRASSDTGKESLRPYTCSVADIHAMTRGITIQYSQKTGQWWTGGVLPDVETLCRACGVSEDLYRKFPEYMKTPDTLCCTS